MAELFPLRPLQQQALDSLKASILAGKRRIIVAAPCGFGKTVLGATMASGALAKGNRVAFCVPQLTLIDQTFTRFVENGIDPADMGVIQGNHAWRRPNAPLQICSVQTLDRRGFPEVKFAIIDEAHLRNKAIDRWIVERPDVMFFGLSATPWSKGMGDIWDELIVPTTLSELIELGWLSKFRVFASAEKPDLSKVKTVAGDYHEGQLADVMGAKTIVADVVSTWLEKGEDRPTLCFAVNRAHAATLHDQFSAAGIESAYVDGETPREERLEILGRYTRGEVRVINSVGTMIVGVDVTCRCIIDAAPTKSDIRHCQKIGRGLRNEPGKTDLILLDHAGNCQRLGLPTSIGRTTLRTAASDAAAKEKTEAERKDPLPRECLSCHCLLPARTKVCPACGAEMRRPSGVETIDGELVEFGIASNAGRESVADRLRKQGKQAIWSQIVTMAESRGWSDGRKAHFYKDIFGVWPRGLSETAVKVCADLTSYEHSKRIAWAKSRKNQKVAKAYTRDDGRALANA